MKYNVYDFDGTIYDGDSGIDIILFAIRKYPKIIVNIFVSCVLYFLRLITKEQFKSRVFSFVTLVEDMDEFLSEFWEKHEKKLKSFWVDKKSHEKDVILSASCRFWLEPVAKRYKVAELIATEIDLETGEVLGKNCHGEEKVRLFYQNFPKGVIEEMYTDSIHDLPLIKESNMGFLVKKDKIYSYYDYRPNIFVRFWRLGWKIYHKNEELWNYLIVGGLTTVVSLGVKWGLLFTIFDATNAFELQLSIIISWIVAVLFAYVTNRIYVFKSESKHYLKEFLSFIGARLLTLGMEMFIMWFFVTFLKMNSNFWTVVWTILTQLLIIIFNYIFSKIVVFKNKDSKE